MFAVSAICLNGFAHTKLFQLRIAAQLYALALVVSGYKAVIIECQELQCLLQKKPVKNNGQ